MQVARMTLSGPTPAAKGPVGRFYENAIKLSAELLFATALAHEMPDRIRCAHIGIFRIWSFIMHSNIFYLLSIK